MTEGVRGQAFELGLDAVGGGELLYVWGHDRGGLMVKRLVVCAGWYDQGGAGLDAGKVGGQLLLYLIKAAPTPPASWKYVFTHLQPQDWNGSCHLIYAFPVDTATWSKDENLIQTWPIRALPWEF